MCLVLEVASFSLVVGRGALLLERVPHKAGGRGDAFLAAAAATAVADAHSKSVGQRIASIS